MGIRRLTEDHVTRHVAAPPGVVYDLVSDVPRTPEWSPEVVGCTWLDGATRAAPGARFRARNRRRWLTWSNVPQVVTAEPGREFAVSRTERGGGTMVWRHRLEPVPDGTAVTLSYEVERPVPAALHRVLRVLLGVRDLHADLHENMRTSLERIADIAEQAATPSSGSLPRDVG